MEFKKFKDLLRSNFQQMTEDLDYLFEVEVDKDEMWDLYLDSFPAGTNLIYRERREYDCSCCRQFIKAIGNAVIIKDNQVKTIWDFETGDEKFQPVLDKLSEYIKSKPVTNIWKSKFKKVGVDNNFEEVEGKIKQWDHFYLDLENKFVDRTERSLGDIKGEFRDSRNVFKRSLDEITQSSLLTVLELISQNSLYKGEEWKNVLNKFNEYKTIYDKLETEEEKGNYTWEQSVKVGGAVTRIRNHSMGTLLTNISEGMDLDLAVKKYEAIVAPENYKRSKPIYTKKMIEDAKKTMEELGYMDSLQRRYATLDDITVNNILFSNKDAAKRMGLDIFDEMSNEVSIDPKKFSRVEEVTMENFMNNILPTANQLEVFLENKHAKNMVSLIAPEVKDSKTMFKWDNNFSWAYSGNMTDSSMKENVKSAGGNVEGILRFSIQWNDEDGYDGNDLDAHCIEPRGNEIFFGSKTNERTTGELDIDIMNPRRSSPAVENITWTDKRKMQEGVYKFYVNNYTHRGGKNGFKAEIEFDGQVYEFEYRKEVRQSEKVLVAEVKFDRVNGFTINEKLPSTTSSKEVWNLQTNQFVPVSVLMHSPNYWDDQEGVGHRHYFFMLKDCVNTEQPNGFYNEFLSQELTKHRKVFEALGGKMAVKDVEDQLSGVGFSSTRRNEVLVKVKGQSERVIKIKL